MPATAALLVFVALNCCLSSLGESDCLLKAGSSHPTWPNPDKLLQVNFQNPPNGGEPWTEIALAN